MPSNSCHFKYVYDLHKSVIVFLVDINGDGM